MEGTILPTPAVAGVLNSSFVEARLHCDLGSNADANKAIQERLTGSIALPIYAVIDPATEEVLGTQAGFTLKDDFVAFLRSAESGE
jgi:hypothetical protein